MRKRSVLLIGTMVLAIIGIIGVTYAFFSYTGTSNNSSLVAGDIYMHYYASNAVIDKLNFHDDNYYEFSVDGKNTSNKNIVYDINIVQGDNTTGRSTRLADKYLVFTLKEKNENNEWDTIVENQSYSDLSSAVRLHVDTIDGGTDEEVERVYRLYYKLGNGFLISDTEENATYDEDTWNNDVYASVKVTVTGNFEEKVIDTITITYNAMGGNVTPTSKQVSPSATYGELPNPTKTGYTFLGWTTIQGSTDYLNFTSPITNQSSHTIFANYQANTYTIKLIDANGEETELPVTYDSSMPTSSVPEKTGYTFQGYYSEPDGQGTKYYNSDMTSSTTYDIANNAILYPYFTPTIYTISYNLDNGTANNLDSYTIETNTFTLNNPSKTGYTFTGWSGTDIDGTSTSVSIAKGSYGDKNYTANFSAITSTVTLNKQNGTGGSDSVAATYDATMPTATAPTRGGYTFGGYYTETNGGGTQYYDASMNSVTNWDRTENTTLYAKWTAINYTISYTLNNGMVTPENPTLYTIETPTFTLNNPTKIGYNFTGWTGTGLATSTSSVTIANGSMGNRSYTANYIVDAITNPSFTVTNNSLNLAGPTTTTTTLTFGGTAYSIAYSSNNTSVVTVSPSNASNLATNNQATITAVGPGTATITVTLTDYDGTETTRDINVTVTLWTENIGYTPPNGITCNGGTCDNFQLMIEKVAEMLDGNE